MGRSIWSRRPCYWTRWRPGLPPLITSKSCTATWNLPISCWMKMATPTWLISVSPGICAAQTVPKAAAMGETVSIPGVRNGSSARSSTYHLSSCLARGRRPRVTSTAWALPSTRCWAASILFLVWTQFSNYTNISTSRFPGSRYWILGCRRLWTRLSARQRSRTQTTASRTLWPWPRPFAIQPS